MVGLKRLIRVWELREWWSEVIDVPEIGLSVKVMMELRKMKNGCYGKDELAELAIKREREREKEILGKKKWIIALCVCFSL
jgi:hypothetical protein